MATKISGSFNLSWQMAPSINLERITIIFFELLFRNPAFLLVFLGRENNL